VYLLLFKQLKKTADTEGRVGMKAARVAMNHTIIGMDRLRIQRALEEMEAFGLLAQLGRDGLTLNKVDVPDF
jgi:hypothetical protein